MKKSLSILLASSMVFSLAACTKTATTSESAEYYDEILYLGNPSVEAPVTYVPEIVVGDFFLDGYRLTFGYDIGTLSGHAEVPLSYGKMLDYIRSPFGENQQPVFVTALSLAFHYEDEKASLTVNWEGGDYKITDTFLFDETANLWYYKQENSALTPVLLNEYDLTRLFPDASKDINKTSTAFLCTEPIYNVRFYRVSDIKDSSLGPDVLLAQYDEYSNDSLFLWQTDSMFKWHLTIEYTDAAGEVHLFYYTVQDGAGIDITYLHELEEPDWNTEAEGEVYEEDFDD